MEKLLALGALVLSAVALVVALVSSADVAPQPTLVMEGEPTGADPELQGRLDALEDRLETLSARMSQLERRPTAPPLVYDGGSAALSAAVQQELGSLRREVQSMVAGEALHSEGGKVYLKDLVREAQADLETERRQQRQLERAAAETAAFQRREQQRKAFVSEARLDYQKEQDFLRRMQAEDDQRRAIIEANRTGEGDGRELRQKLRTLQRENDQAMKAALDDSQDKQYDALRAKERPRGGGGGLNWQGGQRGDGQQPRER